MNLYAVTLALIVLTLLTVSLTRLGKVHTRADYLIAGRSLPAFVLVFTLLSSWIGSGSLLGGAENAYRHGFAALWQAAGGWAGLALIYFIAPRARRSPWLDARSSPGIRPAAASDSAAISSALWFKP